MTIDEVLFGDMIVSDSIPAKDTVVGKPYLFIMREVEDDKYAFAFLPVSRFSTHQEQKDIFHHYKDDCAVFFINVLYNDGETLQIENCHLQNSARTFSLVENGIVIANAQKYSH